MPKLLLVLLLAATPSIIAAPSAAAVAIASQTDPAKLATLKSERAANPRLQKCVYWLAYAEEQGERPEAVLDESAKLNKTAGTLLEDGDSSRSDQALGDSCCLRLIVIINSSGEV
jgi:hypothetical protein